MKRAPALQEISPNKRRRLHSQVPLDEPQATSPDKRHVHEDVVDEEAQGTGSDKSHLHKEKLDDEAQEMAEEFIGCLRRHAHFHQQRDIEVCDDLAGLIERSDLHSLCQVGMPRRLSDYVEFIAMTCCATTPFAQE